MNKRTFHFVLLEPGDRSVGISSRLTDVQLSMSNDITRELDDDDLDRFLSEAKSLLVSISDGGLAYTAEEFSELCRQESEAEREQDEIDREVDVMFDFSDQTPP